MPIFYLYFSFSSLIIAFLFFNEFISKQLCFTIFSIIFQLIFTSSFSFSIFSFCCLPIIFYQVNNFSISIIIDLFSALILISKAQRVVLFFFNAVSFSFLPLYPWLKLIFDALFLITQRNSRHHLGSILRLISLVSSPKFKFIDFLSLSARIRKLKCLISNLPVLSFYFIIFLYFIRAICKCHEFLLVS